MEETYVPMPAPATAEYSEELVEAIAARDVQLVHELVTGLRPGRHLSVIWGEGTTDPGAIRARRHRMSRPKSSRRLWKLLRRADRYKDGSLLADGRRIRDAIEAWLAEVG